MSTLEHDMPTGPDLCLFQILSKYFKPHTQVFGLEIHSGEVLENNHSSGCPSCTWHAYWSLSMPLQSIIKIFQTIKKALSAQEFDLEIYSVKCRRKITKQELSFLHVALLLDLIYAPSKYYQIISDSMGIITCTRFQLQGR